MTLTSTTIRAAQARSKPYKLADTQGLFLLIKPTGGKYWQLKYRVDGREKKLSIGPFPAVGLADARKQRDDAREALAAGKDPSREKLQARLRARIAAANTFGDVADEYLDKRLREGMASSTVSKARYYVGRLGPAFARLPISQITPTDLLAELRKIECKGNYETAQRVLQLSGRIFRYGVATARLAFDPARDLRGALTSPVPKHYGAIIDEAGAGKLLRAIEGYDGQAVTKLALQLSPHVFVRPGELRHAEWKEIDLAKAVWMIPIEKMKMKRAHVVPLSDQAVNLLRELRDITGPVGFAFPSIRTHRRPMSENTVNAALRRLGYTGDEMTAHGFRAMASTLLNESGRWSPDAIERALAHNDLNRVRSAYHRGAHWDERVRMAQWWSDLLDQLRATPQLSGIPTPQSPTDAVERKSSVQRSVFR